MDQIDSNTGAPDRESVQARVLNASPEQVVHAFRAPEHFAQWWDRKIFGTPFIHSTSGRADVWS
jgi:uncharacterized protein YndB with AHSA1/START domain